MDTKDEIALIRKTIKAHCKTLSVVNGRGTAWGWVEIWAKDTGEGFTSAERAALKRVGIDNPGGNYMCISPQERRDWAKRLAYNPKAKFSHIQGDWD